MLQSMGSQRVGHNLVIEQQGITQGLSDLLPSWWRASSRDLGQDPAFLPFLHLELQSLHSLAPGPSSTFKSSSIFKCPSLLSSYNLLFHQDFVLTWATQIKQAYSGVLGTRTRTPGEPSLDLLNPV